MVRDLRLVLLLRVLSCALWGHMHEGGHRRHLSPRFCHSPWSFSGSLRSLVTLPGCKQLVTRASAVLVNMEECMVHAGTKSGSWNNLCIFFFHFSIILYNIYVYLCFVQCIYQLMSNRLDKSSSLVQWPNSPIPCKSAVLILAVEG